MELCFSLLPTINGDIRKYKKNSMIYKMKESTGRFTLYQALQTGGAFGLEYFLSLTNIFPRGGLLLRWNIPARLIYQWNRKLFEVFQKIATKGASDVTFFAINSDKYLAVANYQDGSTRSIKSVIYKWSGSKFNKFQEIATEGPMGCTVFVINNDTFITFANHYNSQKKYSAQSTLFKWSGGHFVNLQSFQTYGARDVKSFNINGHTFLAFANYYSGSKYNTFSFFYKWDGKPFVMF